MCSPDSLYGIDLITRALDSLKDRELGFYDYLERDLPPLHRNRLLRSFGGGLWFLREIDGNLGQNAATFAELAGEEWRWTASTDTYGRGPELLIPVISDEELFSARCVRFSTGEGGSLWVEGSHVQAAIQGELEDVPAPFAEGMFDEDLVFAVHNPISAALLMACGVRACTLARPCATLGDPSALRELVGLGAITHRESPEGTLVILDPTAELEADQIGYLRGFFAEVIEEPYFDGDGLYYRIAQKGLKRSRAASLSRELAGLVRAQGHVHKNKPLPLPPAPELLDDRYDFYDLDGFYDLDSPGPDDDSPPAPTSGPRADEHGFVDLNDIAHSEGEAVVWVVPYVAAAGTITELIGEPKAGKSTFVLEACRAVIEGGDFMGQPCDPGAVVYVSEQTTASMKATTSQMGWNTAGLHFMSVDVHGGFGSFGEILRRVKAKVREVDARLVVFDTLPAVAVMGEGLSSSGPVRRVFAELRQVSALGPAVVVTVHTVKGAIGGNKVPIMASGEGSVAVGGEVDHVVRYTYAGDDSGPLRRVETRGRLSPNETHDVEGTGTAVIKRPSGLAQASGASPLELDVLAVLGRAGGERLGVREIQSGAAQSGTSGASTGGVRRALDRLVEQGHLVVDKSRKKHLYSLSPTRRDVPSSSALAADDDERR